MGRKFGQVSYPKTDFRRLKLRFLAEKKFGKTSFLEVIDYYYRKFFGNKEDEFTVFIISVGSEGSFGHTGEIIDIWTWGEHSEQRSVQYLFAEILGHAKKLVYKTFSYLFLKFHLNFPCTIQKFF